MYREWETLRLPAFAYTPIPLYHWYRWHGRRDVPRRCRSRRARSRRLFGAPRRRVTDAKRYNAPPSYEHDDSFGSLFPVKRGRFESRVCTIGPQSIYFDFRSGLSSFTCSVRYQSLSYPLHDVKYLNEYSARTLLKSIRMRVFGSI